MLLLGLATVFLLVAEGYVASKGLTHHVNWACEGYEEVEECIDLLDAIEDRGDKIRYFDELASRNKECAQQLRAGCSMILEGVVEIGGLYVCSSEGRFGYNIPSDLLSNGWSVYSRMDLDLEHIVCDPDILVPTAELEPTTSFPAEATIATADELVGQSVLGYFSQETLSPCITEHPSLEAHPITFRGIGLELHSGNPTSHMVIPGCTLATPHGTTTVISISVTNSFTTGAETANDSLRSVRWTSKLFLILLLLPY